MDKAYRKLFPGESLDQYIKDEYKPGWQKNAIPGGIITGAIAGFAKGKILGAAIGAVAGGLASIGIYSLDWFGENDEGATLLAAVDEARQNDRDVNFSNFSYN